MSLKIKEDTFLQKFYSSIVHLFLYNSFLFYSISFIILQTFEIKNECIPRYISLILHEKDLLNRSLHRQDESNLLIDPPIRNQSFGREIGTSKSQESRSNRGTMYYREEWMFAKWKVSAAGLNRGKSNLLLNHPYGLNHLPIQVPSGVAS